MTAPVSNILEQLAGFLLAVALNVDSEATDGCHVVHQFIHRQQQLGHVTRLSVFEA